MQCECTLPKHHTLRSVSPVQSQLKLSPNRLPTETGCTRMQACIPWVPGFNFVPCVAKMSICTLQQGKGKHMKPMARSPWLLYPTDKPVTSWGCGWLTNCSLLPQHVHMCIHLSPHPLPQTARNKMSLISLLTLENPSWMSLMLNKEMC